jgi:hypothetical protein
MNFVGMHREWKEVGMELTDTDKRCGTRYGLLLANMLLRY